jgi:adenosylcobinamide-GDP ribazoletransferase
VLANPRQELAYFFGALRFFTRLPVPTWVGHSAAELNAAARYFPAVGLIVGGLGALVYLLATLFWPVPLAIVLSMAATVWVTGAFHEDGLADAADGLGGGWTREDVLRIMKDSRTGSYGVVTLALMLLGKFAALAAMAPALIPAALIGGHAVSRWASGSLIAVMDYAREDMESKAKPLATAMPLPAWSVSAAFAGAGALLCVWVGGPGPVILGVVFAIAVTAWLARKFQRRLGGYTGDCLGATQQAAEMAFYLGLTVTL